MYEDRLGKSVHMLSRQLKREIDLQVAKYGITGVQAGMIQFIFEKSRKKDIFAKDIEKKFDIRRASIAGILQNMEKNGLIKRETIDNDARLRRIVLTNKALDIRKEVEKSIKKVEKQAVQGLTKEETENYIELTKKMSENLEEKERIKK